MDEARQEKNSNVQNHVALGQLALNQQREDLAQKLGASTLVAQGMANQESELRLKDHMDGLSEWNDYLQQTGGEPDKIYQSPVPITQYALQKWTASRAAYAQSVSGAAKVRLTSDFHTKLAQLDDEGFTSVNDMMQADGGMNPDGTPTNMTLQELSNQGARMVDEKQKRAESLAAIRPTISGEYGIQREGIRADNRVDVESIRSDSRKYVADRVEESRKYSTDSNKQINTDKLAAKLQEHSYDFLPHAEYDALHQQMEDIRKTAPSKDRQRLLEEAFKNAVESHKARAGANKPAAAAQPSAPQDNQFDDEAAARSAGAKAGDVIYLKGIGKVKLK